MVECPVIYNGFVASRSEARTIGCAGLTSITTQEILFI